MCDFRNILFFQNLLRAIENIGIVSVYGIRYLSTGNVTQQNFIKFVLLIILSEEPSDIYLLIGLQ